MSDQTEAGWTESSAYLFSPSSLLFSFPGSYGASIIDLGQRYQVFGWVKIDFDG